MAADPHDLPFLAGGGDATRLIAAVDWSTHPLGPPDRWPDGLRTALSLVVNSPESMILLWGPDSTFFFNDAYAPLLGPRVSWAMGARFDRVWADALDQAMPILDAARTGEKPRFVDLPWKLDTDRGAADCWFSFSYSRILGADGAVAGFFIFTNETTARVRADEELRKSRAKLAEALDDVRALNDDLERRVEERTAERDRLWDASPDLLVIIDFDGVFRRANPAWATILGIAPDEVVGRTPWDFIHPDDRAITEAAVIQSRIGELPSFENRFRHRDGSYRWIAWVSAPVGDEIYATGRHVTEEKEAAAALLAAEDQLRQAQKMEAVGQLTGGLAHDFNNLLTVIRGSVDLLRRPDLADARRARYLDAIGETADRAAKLTGQLLAFARRQALHAETFDARDAVDGLRTMIQTLVGPRVHLAVEADAAPCFVHCDRTQFDTAIVNVAVNARDAMMGHGTLSVRVASADGLVGVSIGDTGGGIEVAAIDQIFEPFFTTKAPGEGTGLGLSQVFGFAKQSGGEVTVSSPPGEGATFTLSLPAAAPPADVAAPSSAPRATSPRVDLCVLVVEDNPEVATFALQALGELGCRTAFAPSATAALGELEAGAHQYDLVFSDVVMPGMSGIDLAAEIERRYPGLPVVLTSGYSDAMATDGTAGRELLRKPYSLDDLSRTLARVA